MGDEALKAAQSCAKPQIDGYRGLSLTSQIVTRAHENSLVIRSCYAQVPKTRDKQLAKELKRAHRAMRRNDIYQMIGPKKKAIVKRSINSAYWIIPGSDLRYTNDCVRPAYKDPTNSPGSFRTSFENIQVVHRCVQDPAERKAAEMMELARNVAALQTSRDSSNPELNLVRAAIAAIDDSAASCLIPRYHSYEEVRFGSNIVSNAHNNAEAIRACYHSNPSHRDHALVEDRAQARRSMEQKYQFRTGTAEEKSWLLAAIDAVTWTNKGADSYQSNACIRRDYKSYDYDRYNLKRAFSIAESNGAIIRRCLPKGKERTDALALESNRAIAAMRSADPSRAIPKITTDEKMRQVVQGGGIPEWPPEPEMTQAEREAAGQGLLLLGKGLFTIICGPSVGLSLALLGEPGIAWDACTSVW